MSNDRPYRTRDTRFHSGDEWTEEINPFHRRMYALRSIVMMLAEFLHADLREDAQERLDMLMHQAFDDFGFHRVTPKEPERPEEPRYAPGYPHALTPLYPKQFFTDESYSHLWKYLFCNNCKLVCYYTEVEHDAPAEIRYRLVFLTPEASSEVINEVKAAVAAENKRGTDNES